MKPRRSVNFAFIVIAPPVLALALLGVWLSVRAGVENLKYGRVSQQVVMAVARARAMRIRTNAEPLGARAELLTRMAEADGAKLVMLAADRAGGEPERAALDPWGNPMRFFLYPAQQALRIELLLSRTACLRLLDLYSDDVSDIGLRRIDVREVLPSALWRLVYENTQNRTDEHLDRIAISAGCGQAAQAQLSLTFTLK